MLFKLGDRVLGEMIRDLERVSGLGDFSMDSGVY
jgi:hypothetical protein